MAEHNIPHQSLLSLARLLAHEAASEVILLGTSTTYSHSATFHQLVIATGTSTGGGW